MEQGVIPYAPHLLFPQWMDDADPAQRTLATRMGLAMLEHADELWVCSETMSAGMKAEIEFAEVCCIPVRQKPDLVHSSVFAEIMMA
jgi:hypothetical protein